MTEKPPRESKVSSDKFKPYALAIGQMNLSWNELHETMGYLFVRALESSNKMSIQMFAVWGAITNDRQKRAILDVAINWIGKDEHQKYPKLAADVLWLTKRAASLEEQRNNVIHSPLSEASGIVAAVVGLNVGDIFPGGSFNDRATKLSKATVHAKKDLLAQIISYRDYGQDLTDFATGVYRAWKENGPAWPEKPRLPPLTAKG